ncbi:hypothetical protein GALMADRAFT_880756 [Galerina marginata CBS 339.88]|uniref:Uncharacterized protein n=1 Tax=Galerina marginata (strain CBS 339.88) TaxID=685588 RepID=A0A067SSK5_GALM3|nr:hypothetical protein GALMADRAFT_880756 [Galerina marginata CBS 339.88]
MPSTTSAVWKACTRRTVSRTTTAVESALSDSTRHLHSWFFMPKLTALSSPALSPSVTATVDSRNRFCPLPFFMPPGVCDFEDVLNATSIAAAVAASTMTRQSLAMAPFPSPSFSPALILTRLPKARQQTLPRPANGFGAAYVATTTTRTYLKRRGNEAGRGKSNRRMQKKEAQM